MVFDGEKEFGGFDAHTVRMSLWAVIGILSDRYEAMKARPGGDHALQRDEFQTIDLFSLSTTRSRFEEVNQLITLAKLWAADWNCQIDKGRTSLEQKRAYQRIGACLRKAYAMKCAYDFGQKEVMRYSFFDKYEHREIKGQVWESET